MLGDKISAAVISEAGEEPRSSSPEPYYYSRSVHLNAAARSPCIPPSIEYNSARSIKRERCVRSRLERTENSRRNVSLVVSRDTVNRNRKTGNYRPASNSADGDQCGSSSSATVEGEDSTNFRRGEGATISKHIEGTVVNSCNSNGEDDLGFTTPRATVKHYVCPGAPKKPLTVFRIRNKDLRSVARRLNFDDLATWESTDTEVIDVRNDSIG